MATSIIKKMEDKAVNIVKTLIYESVLTFLNLLKKKRVNYRFIRKPKHKSSTYVIEQLQKCNKTLSLKFSTVHLI